MSEEITADAVPFKDNTEQPRNNLEDNQENISVCEEDKRRAIAMNTQERMAESSDSSDSNDTDSRITNFQNNGASLIATSTNEVNPGAGNRTQNIQHQVVIQNPTAPIHLGPVYNLNIGQSQPMRQQNTPATTTFQNTNNSAERDDRPPKEEMRPLWYSKRVIDHEELPSIARNMGANWKAVGNGLKYNWAQLDQFEADTNTMVDAIQRMLFRWIQWKDQKATVGKLTKVLFNHGEYDAIRVLKP